MTLRLLQIQVLFILLFAAGRPLLAQPAAVHLRTERLTVADGLPQGLVHAIIQDRTGFLWFGTKDGLARWDGYGFTVLRHDPRDSTSICGNQITALLEDREGKLWVGTQNNGVSVLDPATGLARQVSAPVVSFLREDSAGRYWAISKEGEAYVYLPGEGNGDPAFALAAGRFPQWPALHELSDLEVDGTGRIWIVNADSVMSLVLGPTGSVQVQASYPLKRAYDDIRPPLGSDLVPDPLHERFFLITPNSIVHIPWSDGLPTDTVAIKGQVVRMAGLLERSGLLLSTMLDFSLSRIDPGTGSVTPIVPVLDHPDPREGPIGCSGVEDRQGNIWVGSSGNGAFEFPIGAQRFHTTPFRGRLIVADTAAAHVLTTGTYEAMEGTKALPAPMRTALKNLKRDREIMPDAFIDEEGRLWLLTLSPTRPDVHLVIMDRDGALEQPALPATGSLGQMFLGRDGTLLLTHAPDYRSQVDRLMIVDPRTGSTRAEHLLPWPLDASNYSPISSCTVAPDRTIWLGTNDGLMGLDPASGKWRTYRNDPSDSTSLPGNVVFAICLDPAEPGRYLWVGLEGLGLSRLELRTGRFTTYTTANGLPNNVVYAILPDAHGSLWLSTNKGLCCFDPRTGGTHNYSVPDGLPGNEFNRYSAARSHDGRLFFVGMEGLVWFDPHEFHRHADPSPTVLIGLKLLNRPVSPRSHPELVNVPIDRLRRLVLPYDERMIAFDFACLDFSAPAQNEFRFMLEGLNKTWIENGTGHEAIFTNLDPGHYRFRVQGRNSAGVWDEQGAELALTITPPWWGTWWSRTLAVLMVFAFLYGLFRYRLTQQLHVALVRDRIARDLHDEIGSTLSSVALFSEVAKRRSNAAETGRNDMLDRISESTSQMVESMNDIVWAVSSKNDDLLTVAQRMQEFAGRVAEACGFELDFSFEGIDAEEELNMVQRKNLYLILKEAVNNAAKYSRCKTLTVRIRNDGKTVVLSVQDDGVGASPDAGAGSKGGGNGLGNMHARAAEIGGTLKYFGIPGKGTTVELRFKP